MTDRPEALEAAARAAFECEFVSGHWETCLAQESWRKLTEAAITAYLTAMRAQGYKLVGRDIGADLEVIGARSIRDSMSDTNFSARARSCWQDIHDAAPDTGEEG